MVRGIPKDLIVKVDITNTDTFQFILKTLECVYKLTKEEAVKQYIEFQLKSKLSKEYNIDGMLNKT
jgi:hypothetical protein